MLGCISAMIFPWYCIAAASTRTVSEIPCYFNICSEHRACRKPCFKIQPCPFLFVWPEVAVNKVPVTEQPWWLLFPTIGSRSLWAFRIHCLPAVTNPPWNDSLGILIFHYVAEFGIGLSPVLWFFLTPCSRLLSETTVWVLNLLPAQNESRAHIRAAYTRVLYTLVRANLCGSPLFKRSAVRLEQGRLHYPSEVPW